MLCHPKEIFKNQKLADQFKCPINQGVLNNPYLDSCGHSFCFSCIETWLNNKKQCPVSEKDIEKSQLKINVLAKNVISKMDVYCPKKKSGCKWEGKLEQYQKHLREECEFEEFFCKNVGCSEKIPKKDYAIHEKKCVYKIIECEHCEQEIITKEKDNHLKKCLKINVLCENKCGKNIIREKMHQHIKEDCDNTVIQCPFPQCDAKEKRKNIINHIYSSTGYIKHQKLLNNRIDNMEEMVSTFQNVTKQKEYVEEENYEKDYKFDVINRSLSTIINTEQNIAVKIDNENLNFIFLNKNLSQKTKYNLTLGFSQFIYLGVAKLEQVKEQEFIHTNKFMDNIFLIKMSSQARIDGVKIELEYDSQTNQINFSNQNVGRQSSLVLENKKLEELTPCIVLVNKGDHVQI